MDMTEKRFKEYYQGKTIVSVHDTKNNNELVNILQCVDLLNRIADENEQLKSFIKRLTNNCGEIVLMNGNAYNVKKALGDLCD